MAKLVCQTGPTAGHEYPLSKDVTTMGRQSTCDIQILDNMSSRVNCQVRRDGKLYSLVDLGSRNGTNLNGKKVTERQLTFGDRIRIGEVEYLFVKEPGDVELKDLLSKYEVQEKIGEGGMGIVYKANQRSMNRIVALKILSPKYSSRPRFVEQFIREARAAGQLNHPNIIQVHDVGTENDIHYFSMEFVDGPTCMQALREHGPFKTPEALEIIRQTARALEYAHGQRLIHQDIKPDNIMLGHNNTVKLADLGISKTFDEAESEEGPKRVMGTPHYMAPEAALGKKIDHRVDIYSLGATLYHLLTGKTPYSGTSATEVLKAHVMDPLPPIHDIVPDVPEAVCALVERMVAKKADDRYATATQVIEEVKRLQAGAGLSTERIGGGETMLLRRFAAGPAAPGTTPSAASTTGTRTPRHDEGGTTAERPLKRQNQNIPGLSTAVALVILALIGMTGWHFLNMHVNQEPSKESGQVLNKNEPAKETAPPQQPVIADNGVAQRQGAALSALEERLRTGNEQLDLNALRQQVEELMAQKLQDANQVRAKALIERIGVALQRRKDQLVEQDVAALKVEIQKLLDEHNYELALKRIESFKDKDEAVAKDRLASLRDEVQKARDSFIGNLHTRVLGAIALKSSAQLKELRDQLPPALIGTASEQEINDALKTIEDEVAAQQQQVVSQVAGELLHWRFAQVEDLVRGVRTTMGNTTAGKQLDSYLDTARRLNQFTTTIADRLSSAGHKPRYHGTLNRWTDPDLVGAEATGLQLQVVGGATASVDWKDIAPDVLSTIAKLVLTKDEVEQYRPAIDVLAALKPSGGKDK
jgi:serine/threonine protein kinase